MKSQIYSQNFAEDGDCIFFAHSVLKKVQLSSQMYITMKKVISNNLTARTLSKNSKQTVKELIAKDKDFSFMSSIQDTPAYQKKIFASIFSNG